MPGQPTLPGVEFWGCAPARRQCQRFWGCGDCGAALKAHPNLDFRWYRESPRPGEGLLFRKEAKARAVLGLAEPVHPLPHLPRQSRLFGRRFRLHSPCGGRGTRFAQRAACLNPALALRMRARGSSSGRGGASAIYAVRAKGSIERDNSQTSVGRRQGCMRSIAGL